MINTGLGLDYWSSVHAPLCGSFCLLAHLTSPPDHGAEEGSAESPCLETYHFFRALLRRLNLTSECCLVNGTHCGEGEGGEGRGSTRRTDPAQGLELYCPVWYPGLQWNLDSQITLCGSHLPMVATLLGPNVTVKLVNRC